MIPNAELPEPSPHCPPPRPIHRFKWKRFLSVFGVLIGVVWYVLYGYCWDGPPPPHHPALEVPLRQEVPSDQNAYTYFLQATNLVVYSRDRLTECYDELEAETNGFDSTRSFLEENSGFLEPLKLGLQQERCQAPELDSFSDLLPEVTYFLQMSKILSLQTQLYRLEGRWDDAVAINLLHLDFSRRLMGSAESVIGYLVGITVMGTGLKETHLLVLRGENSPETDVEINQVCSKLSSSILMSAKRAFRCERRIMTNETVRIADGRFSMEELADWEFPRFAHPKLLPGFVFKLNTTLTQVDDHFLCLIIALEAVGSGGGAGEVSCYEGRTERLAWNNNPVGNLWLSIILPAEEGVTQSTCRAKVTVDSIRVINALHRFKKQNGRLPENLSQLVPQFLSEVPTDPFDGKPLRYLPERDRVYSFGEDRIDQGGSVKNEDGERVKRRSAEDFAFGIHDTLGFEQSMCR